MELADVVFVADAFIPSVGAEAAPGSLGPGKGVTTVHLTVWVIVLPLGSLIAWIVRKKK